MKFTNECPIELTELTKDDACLVKVPPAWMSKGEKDVCYFISEGALLKTRECSITRRNAYYFKIKLSDLSLPDLRNLCSSNVEPYDLITDTRALILRTENFPWELRRYPSHELLTPSHTHPLIHTFSSSVIFGTMGLLTVLMLQSTLKDDVENYYIGLFAFVLLVAVVGGTAEYCLRKINYNSSGLFSEGLKLIRSMPVSDEPHRHVTMQQL